MSIQKIYILLNDKNQIFGVYKNMYVMESTMNILKNAYRQDKFHIKEYIMDSNTCIKNYFSFTKDHTLRDVKDEEDEEDEIKYNKQKKKDMKNIIDYLNELYSFFMEDKKTYMKLTEKNININNIPDFFIQKYYFFKENEKRSENDSAYLFEKYYEHFQL